MLFTSRDYGRCEASEGEAVVFHREPDATIARPVYRDSPEG